MTELARRAREGKLQPHEFQVRISCSLFLYLYASYIFREVHSPCRTWVCSAASPTSLPSSIPLNRVFWLLEAERASWYLARRTGTLLCLCFIVHVHIQVCCFQLPDDEGDARDSVMRPPHRGRSRRSSLAATLQGVPREAAHDAPLK